MTNDDNKIVIIGKIGAPKGISGWLKINACTQPKQKIFDYQPWLIQRHKQWQPLKIARHQQTANQIIVQLEGITDRNSAQEYTNALIGVYRKQLPALPKEEYYWTDLEGLQVYTQAGELLGTVDRLVATGSNDVLVVKGKKEYLIPYFLHETVTAIDLKAGTMHVDWDLDF